MRVNWILVWAGFFAIYYPLTALTVRIVQPSQSFMPDWLFAGNLALVWTFLAWTGRYKLQYKKPVRAKVRRMGGAALKVAGRSSAFAFVVGVVGRFCVGRPTWIEIATFAVANGLSVILSDVLFAGSGLRVREKRESR